MFIYRASHDLKGPIDRLLGLTQITKLENLKPVTFGYVDKIELGAKQLNQVLNKLTNVHHINKGKPEMTPIKLKDGIDQIVRNFHPDLLNGFKINVKIPKSEVINCDLALFQIIAENLIENALIFNTKIEKELIISINHLKNKIELVFEDNGPGISSEFHDKIFDMFYRASELSQGNGLGLYLVKKSIDKLEGEIKIESELNDFTRITVTLIHKTVRPPKSQPKRVKVAG